MRRAFFMAALTTIRSDSPNRNYYQRERAEGRGHHQALIALARRRVDVLWALLRDNRSSNHLPGPPNRVTGRRTRMPSGHAGRCPAPRPASEGINRALLGWTLQGPPENPDRVKTKPLRGRLRRVLTRPRTPGGNEPAQPRRARPA